MPASNNAILQVLQTPNSDQRLEVAIEQHEGTEQIVLRHATWTDGLGWCGQKTIRLDAEHLDDLHRALTVARHRRNRRAADAGRAHKPAQVIQLPTLA